MNQDGTIDPTFQPPEMDGFVQQIVVQPDGAILIGGRFNLNGSADNQYLARLLSDGSLDPGFRITVVKNQPASDPPLRFALQPDGKVVIGGIFSEVNGIAHSPLARLNADGGLDETFQARGIAGSIRGIGIQADGKILAIGSISIGTNTPLPIVRLEKGGGLDPSFNSSRLPFDWNPLPVCFAIQNDGRILLGLSADLVPPANAQHTLIPRIMRDGSLDETFQYIAPMQFGSYEISALAMQTNGQILVGGILPITDAPLLGIGRLNGDAAPNITTPPASQSVLAGNPVAFTVAATGSAPLTYQWQKDGQKLAGETNSTLSLTHVQASDFGDYSVLVSNSTGAVVSQSAHLNFSQAPGSAGALDTSFKLGFPPSAENVSLESAQLLPDGNVLVEANLVKSSSVYDSVWKVNSEGAFINDISDIATIHGGAYIEKGSYVLAVQPDNKILISQHFPWASWENPIFRFNTDGSPDTSFSSPGCEPFSGSCGINALVSCMAVQTDGKIVIGGYFSQDDNTPINRVARLLSNGNLDTNFDPGVITAGDNTNSISNDTFIQHLILLPDDRIIFEGAFNHIAGLERVQLARLQANGSVDDSFNAGAGANGNINTLVLDSAQRILIAGDFTQVQGQPRQHIARLLADGQLDTTFDPGAGPDKPINCLAVQTDGKVWLGGGFTHVDGFPCNLFARLNSNGSRDTNFNPGNGFDVTNYLNQYVSSMELQTNGDLLLLGSFASYNGVPCGSLIRLHGDPAPPRLLMSDITLNKDGFTFQLQGISGTGYDLQSSTNLLDWQTITNVQSTGTVMQLTFPAPATIPRRFYRAVTGQ